MGKIDIIMPKMGESVAEATIIKWLKNEGEMVTLDEPLLEIATDKVDSEIPSVVAGVLLKQNYKEGDIVQVGKVIAIIDSLQEGSISKMEQDNNHSVLQTPTNSIENNNEIKPLVRITSAELEKSNKFYSPLVRNIAKSEGINLIELDTFNGSGKNGRVTKQDMLTYLNRKASDSQHSQNTIPQIKSSDSKSKLSNNSYSVNGTDEIIEMDRMRKIIADHMVHSKHIAPHVTSFVEVDVTNIVNWRNKMKNVFESKEQQKLTFTPIFIEAIAKSIRDFPMINISVEGTKIIVHKQINIGMAAALPSGNLIVPVIKDADRLNLIGLTKSVNDLTNRARINKLKPDEIQGGTYTMSNVGTFGNVMGTPIINQPQCAIMAIGAIRKKPAVIETPQGDTIGIRHFLFLSHSYDHRVIDGALGGSFVRRVADYLENFDINRNC